MTLAFETWDDPDDLWDLSTDTWDLTERITMAVTKAPAIDNLSAKENEAQKITGFPQPGTADSAGYSLAFVAVGTTLTATAGSGTLPATPSGFLEAISPAGNVIKIPFYDA